MFTAQHFPYRQTKAFSQLVNNYLQGDARLRPFHAAPPTLDGIRQTLEEKKVQPVDRALLVHVLREQYAGLPPAPAVEANIERLASPQCFTVTTAHQPNLFTGPLYFIYKILHAIRLAATLEEALPDHQFVPVYYMGSEDADFAELNHTYVDGKLIEWKKEQRGAVGRMVADKTLSDLVTEMEGQLSVEAFGAEVIGLLRRCYSPGKTIQQATLELVHALYGSYGLVVLIPDHPELKRTMLPVFRDDLFTHRPAALARATSEKLEAIYTAQAFPRDVNLFYLKDDIRERIIRSGSGFTVHNTNIRFTDQQMEEELQTHPERFSPNVILRGLYQETILPNIAFVGGGGELAYWLQLKDVFDAYKVVFPVLVLRNSFLVVPEKWMARMERLGFAPEDFFASEDELMRQVVERSSGEGLRLNGTVEQTAEIYGNILHQVRSIDPTLAGHVEALKTKALKALSALEKKMLRAEKRKHADQERGIRAVREALFPGGGLQERRENFSYFYALWGPKFIDALYRNARSLEQQFTILCQSH